MENNNPFPFVLEVSSDLLLLLSKNEHDRLQELFQRSFTQMDAIAFTPRKREEVQKLSGQGGAQCDVTVFYDRAVDRHVTEIVELLKKAGWRHVSGDISVLIGEILDYIFKTFSTQGKNYYPMIAIASGGYYKHHNFQRLFLDTCRERCPHDGSRSQKELCDLHQTRLVQFIVAYSRHIGTPVDHLCNENACFFHACRLDNLHLAQYLYRRGGVDVRNSSCGSPWHVACEAEHEGASEVAEWLRRLHNPDLDSAARGTEGEGFSTRNV